MGLGYRTAVLVALAAAGLATAGCGSEEGGGSRTLNWYVFKEPGGGYDAAVAKCNKGAGGRYQIKYVALPTDANQQRELLVRRLAAEDTDIDIIGMDVIWTAEFAEAEWIAPWEGRRRQVASEDKLDGPLRSVTYRGRVWGIPFTSNTQLLWYRKDKVKSPPGTWDEMIEEAKRQNSAIEEQGRQYEGFTVWVNSLIASAGGQIVDERGNVKVDASARRAAEIIKRVATEAGAPGLATAAEDDGRLGFEGGRSIFQVNYPFIYASAAEVKGGFQKKIGWARWPAVEEGRPSRPPLGGINLGVSNYSENRDLAFEAAECLAQPANQAVATEKGGLPPTTQAVYDDPKVKKAYPFADVLQESIEAAAPRPISPAYSDISQAIQRSFHPPDKLEPEGIEDKLKDRLEKAAEGSIF